MQSERFADPSDYAASSCGPTYPKDKPEDIFRECMDFPKPMTLQNFASQVDAYCLELFRAFWREWSQIEEVPSHASGEEGAIALLQTMTKSKTRDTALTAYCYLLAIARTPLSQTDVAKLFWPSDPYTHKATVNARVIDIRDDLGLGKSRGMKRDSARESYSFRASKIHNNRINQQKEICKNHTYLSLAQQAISLSSMSNQ